MKIVIMSDSHGRNEIIDKIINENNDADYFYHLGDLCCEKERYPQLSLVRGNNDFDFTVADYLIVEFNGLKILFTHGHKFYGIPYNAKLIQLAKRNEIDIIFYGHEHLKMDETVDGVRFINPGALSYNRDGSQIGYLILNVNIDGSYIIQNCLVK